MNRDKEFIENQDERRRIARRELHGEGKRTWRGGKTRDRQRAHLGEASIRRYDTFVIILRNGHRIVRMLPDNSRWTTSSVEPR